jgi:hypothetical protein
MSKHRTADARLGGLSGVVSILDSGWSLTCVFPTRKGSTLGLSCVLTALATGAPCSGVQSHCERLATEEGFVHISNPHSELLKKEVSAFHPPFPLVFMFWHKRTILRVVLVHFSQT